MASKLANDESPIFNNKELRIVLVGKTGTGKSAAANTILGGEYFKSTSSSESMTIECAKASAKIDGQKIAVIDTPCLFDTRFTEDKTNKYLGQCIKNASPGPHIFLIIVKLDIFTEADKNTVRKIQEIFGADADKYCMVLFTHGDKVKGKWIEKFVNKSKDLEELMDNCNGQFHVFDSTLKERSQVRELLDKIRNITDRNGGTHYTNAMFQKEERALEAERQKVLREQAEELRKQRENVIKAMEEKYREQFEQSKNDMKKQLEIAAACERETDREIAALQKQYEKNARALAEATRPIIIEEPCSIM